MSVFYLFVPKKNFYFILCSDVFPYFTCIIRKVEFCSSSCFLVDEGSKVGVFGQTAS